MTRLHKKSAKYFKASVQYFGSERDKAPLLNFLNFLYEDYNQPQRIDTTYY
jgi:hypothetical protein